MQFKTFNALILSLSSLMAISALAAGQSQTFIRRTNGLIQTMPAAALEKYDVYTPGVKVPYTVQNVALLFDKRNSLPERITAQGGNYAFFEGGILTTVDENGGFWYKGKQSFEPAILGGNFFITKGNNEIIAIDSAGFYNSTGISERSARLVGGNFFIDQAGVLTTIKHIGMAPGNPLGMITKKEGWNFSDAIRAGGNWFEKVDGSIVTINSQNGFFSDFAFTPDSLPEKVGGNYFVGKDGFLYTISGEGVLKKNLPVLGNIAVYGYSYMIADDGYFIFIDERGEPHTEMVRVSTTGIRAGVVTQIKDTVHTENSFIKVRQ